jgi:5'-nucleotidase
VLFRSIDLKIDRKSRDVIEAKADNVIVRTDAFAKDPEQTSLIAAYEKVAGPLIERPVGKIAAALTREETPAGESALGDLIADAQWELTKAADKGKAEFAVTNPGGIRTDLPKKTDDGRVTYGEIFATQPFGNNLVTLTLSGAEIRTMLEQQWIDQPKQKILQVSKTFSYTWDAAKPVGERVDPASITVAGKPVDPAGSYRVTVNNFLADGGDGFKIIRKGRDQLPGIFDVDALEAHLGAAGTIEVPARDRIKRVN